MASCSCSRPQLLSSSAQASLISSAPHRRTSLSLPAASPSFLHKHTLRSATLSTKGSSPSSSRHPTRWSVRCSAAGMGAASGPEESPYLILGVSALEKFEVIKATYNRKRKEAEKRGDDATVERLDKAYDKLMMMQLSNRKQGLSFRGFSVSKEIKYADKRSWIPWGPKRAPSERKDILINLAISALFSAWIVAVGGQADWKPLQFLIFGYIFRIFTKLGEFEPAPAPTFVEEGEEEEGGGSREDTSRRLRNGKRLLRTLGLVFSCVAFASLAYTGTLNGYEYAVQYVPRALMGAQEVFVTGVTAFELFVIASFYR